MDNYTYALIGGVALGSSGAVLLLVSGKVLGVSGILNGVTEASSKAARSENLAFLVGLVLAPGLLAYANGGTETNASSDLWLLAISGLLVGVGARLANGCTSGHSISGTARFSLRSYAASFTYLLVAALVYSTLVHGFGVDL